MSWSSRSLTWFNLVVILSLLLSLFPLSHSPVAAEAGSDEEPPVAALDSPLPPPDAPIAPPTASSTGGLADVPVHHLLTNQPSVSTFSGAATYAYPIQLPAGRNGLAPRLSLNYNSGALNGLMGAVQSGEVGLGWNIGGAMQIVRPIKTHLPSSGGCGIEWEYKNDFNLVINGTSHKLVGPEPLDDDGGCRYYAEDAPGLLVMRYTPPGDEGQLCGYGAQDAPSDQQETREYWVVTDASGTTYRYGFNEDSEQVAPMDGYTPACDGLGETCGNVCNSFPGYAGEAERRVAYRWSVDEIRDVYSNTITYGYFEPSVTTPGDLNIAFDREQHLSWIRYTGNDAQGDSGRYLVKFEREARVDQNGAGHDDGLKGEAGPGSEQEKRPWSMWDEWRIDRIRVCVGNCNAGNVVAEYDLDYQFVEEEHPGGEWLVTTMGHETTRLRSITHYGWDEQGVKRALPSTTFDYGNGGTDSFVQAHDTVDRPDNGKLRYPRLLRVNNGYGGQTEFTYNVDHPVHYRGVCSYPVNAVDVSDGLGHSAQTRYDYYGACFDGHGDGDDNCRRDDSPSYGLIGHQTVHEVVEDYDGSMLSSVWHYFITGKLVTQGRETMTRVFATEESTWPPLRGVYTDWAIASHGPTTFAHVNWVESVDYTGNPPLSVKAYHIYDSYGNLTRVDEHKQDGTRYRIKKQKFTPNTEAWIVNKPTWSGVFDDDWNILSLTYYVYDDQDDWRAGPGNHGRLTLTRARVQPDPTPDSEQVELTVDARFGYNAYGNQTTQTVYKDYGEIKYDGSKWIDLRVGGGAAYTTTTTYDSTSHTYPVAVTNPLGHVSRMQYYGLEGVSLGRGLPGQVYRAWDANGEDTATAYAYDAFGRLTKVARPDDDLDLPTTRYVYADRSTPFKVESWQRETSGCSDCEQPVFSFYDGLGRVVQSRVETKNAFKQAVVNTSYDALGRVRETSVPVEEDFGWDFNPSDWSDRPKTSTQYDALGRVTQVTQTDGTTVRAAYDGWRTATLDENGHQKIQEVDAFGRLVTVEEYTKTLGSNVLYATTQYDYNEMDALVSVTDAADNVTTMAYDALGRKTEMDDPDMGIWTYAYNPPGGLTYQRDARGCVTILGYDELNRLESKSYSGPGACASTAEVSYTYDQGTNGIGRRTRMEDDDSGYTTWSYDERGRVIQEIKVINDAGGGTFKTRWKYDAADRIEWIKYPGGDGGQEGERVDYAYTDQGLLDSVVGMMGSETYVQDTVYDAAGRVELRVLGDDVLRTGYTYYPWTTLNGRGRLKQVTTGKPLDLTSLQNLHYTYDAVGNVWTIQDHKAGSPPPGAELHLRPAGPADERQRERGQRRAIQRQLRL